MLPRGALRSLTTLSLWGNKVDDDAVGALAAAAKNGALPGVVTLQLDRNEISDLGVAALSDALASGGLKQLEHLNLAYNRVGDAGMKALGAAIAGGALVWCVTLNLASNHIGDAGLLTFVQLALSNTPAGLPKLAHLTELWLADNLIGEPGATALANARAAGALPKAQLVDISTGSKGGANRAMTC